MRTIKFKGKTIKSEWVYGDLLHIACGCIIYHGSQTECTCKQNEGAVLELFSNEISVVIPETVGQFTGLTDKNGKEIFENDIVEMWGKIHEIKFINGAFEFVKQDGKKQNMIDTTISEIIGNIHDNKNLIK